VHRQARVDDGVDEDDVSPFDLHIEILQEADAFVVLAVARELEEVEGMMDRRRAREVADEGDARLERPDEQRLLRRVVTRQLLPDLTNPSADLLRVEEDLADSLVAFCQRAQDAFRSPKRAASRSKSRS
jgi:hypothetical protein